uniref:Uncharacterized protein n=1 Tax=Tetranychus urticae TaxID=32264 RepID=T1KDY2_TETUR
MNFLVLIVCLFINFSDGSVINCENGCLDRPIMLSQKATFQASAYTLIAEPKRNGTQLTLKRSDTKAALVNVYLNDTRTSTTLTGQCNFAASTFYEFLTLGKGKPILITSQLDRKTISIEKKKCSWMLPLNVTIPGVKKPYATRNSTYWLQVVADNQVVIENKRYRLSFSPSTVSNLLTTVCLIVLSWVIS